MKFLQRFMFCFMRQDRQSDDRSVRQVAVSTGTPQRRECFRDYVLRINNSAHKRRLRGYHGAQFTFETNAHFLFSPNTEKKSPFECDLLLRQFSRKPVFKKTFISVELKVLQQNIASAEIFM
jgi:hypothetical protein